MFSFFLHRYDIQVNKNNAIQSFFIFLFQTNAIYIFLAYEFFVHMIYIISISMFQEKY